MFELKHTHTQLYFISEFLHRAAALASLLLLLRPLGGRVVDHLVGLPPCHGAAVGKQCLVL